MQRFKNSLLLSAITSVGLAGSASAGIVGLTNADFETGDQDVTSWFDHTTDNGDLIQDEAGNLTTIPDDTDGEGWLNLVDKQSFDGNPRGVYQDFGTHESNVASYQIDLTIGQRSDTAGFEEVFVELFYGSATGADGSTPTAVGLSAADSKTITGSDYFATPTTKGTATVQLLLDASAVGAGDTLWLSFKTDLDETSGIGAEQQLIDDVSVTGVLVPEPGSLALLGLGGLLIARRRRDD